MEQENIEYSCDSPYEEIRGWAKLLGGKGIVKL